MASCNCNQCSSILFGGMLASLEASSVRCILATEVAASLLTSILWWRSLRCPLKGKIGADQSMIRFQIGTPKGAAVLYTTAPAVADRDVINLSPGLRCTGRTTGGISAMAVPKVSASQKQVVVC
ncbi:unnamed protein product, partial [Schistosoma spindalis]